MAALDLVRASLRARPGRTLFRILIGLVATGLALSAAQVRDAVDGAYAATDRRARGADVRVTLSVRPHRELDEAIAKVEGTGSVAYRLRVRGTAEGPEGPAPCVLQVVEPDAAVQRPILVRGRHPRTSSEILLESGLAGVIGADPGTEIRLEAQGRRPTFRVVGHVVDFGKPPYPNWSFGTAYLPWELAAEGFDLRTEVANEVLARTDGTIEPPVLRDRLVTALDAERRAAVTRGYFRQVTEGALGPLVILLRVFGIVAAVTGGAFLLEELSGRIARDRRRIGLLAAMGTPRRTIVAVYAGEVLLPYALGALLGIPAGALASRFPAEQMASGLGLLPPAGLSPAAVVQGLAVSLGAATLATLGPSLLLARREISPIVRGDPPTRSSVAGRVASLPTGRPLGLGLRLALGHPLRFGVTLTGLGAMLAALYFILAMWGFIRSFEDPAVHGFDYDVVVTTPRPREALDHLETSPIVEAAQEQRRTWARFGRDDLSAVVYGYEPEGTLHRPRKMLEGRWLENPGELVLGRALANRLGVGLGAKLPLGGRVHPQVVGIAQSFYNGGFVVFADRSSFRRAYPGVGAVIIGRLAPGEDGRALEDVEGPPLRVRGLDPTFGGSYVGTVAVVLVFISFLLAATATVGLATSVGAIVFQRRRTFAILGTLGASPLQLLGVVGGLAGSIGVGAGGLGILIAHHVYVPLVGSLLIPDFGPVDLPVSPVALVVFNAALLGVSALAALAAWWSTVRAEPASDLR